MCHVQLQVHLHGKYSLNRIWPLSCLYRLLVSIFIPSTDGLKGRLRLPLAKDGHIAML